MKKKIELITVLPKILGKTKEKYYLSISYYFIIAIILIISGVLLFYMNFRISLFAMQILLGYF